MPVSASEKENDTVLRVPFNLVPRVRNLVMVYSAGNAHSSSEAVSSRGRTNAEAAISARSATTILEKRMIARLEVRLR